MVYYNLSGYNSGMLLVGIFSWWYKEGLIGYIESVRIRLELILDLFSINLMLKTLFAPFRQISANETGISINAKILVFFDKLLSRVIGSIVRMVMIVVGITAVVFALLLSFIGLVLWILVPLMPVLGVVGYLCL